MQLCLGTHTPARLAAAAAGAEYVSLEELLQKSDIVSLHCPLMPSTFHLMNLER